MEKNKNNIISFEKFKRDKLNRNKKDYILDSVISVDLKRDKNGCKIDIYSEEDLNLGAMYVRVAKCLNHISKDVPKFSYDYNEFFETHFSILYFINSKDSKDINPIFTPSKLSKQEIAKYLYVTLIMIENQKRTT